MLKEQGVALLTISTDYVVDDPVASMVETRLRATGRCVAARGWARPTEADIRTQLLLWIVSPAIETVIMCGAPEQATAVLKPFVTDTADGMMRCAGTRVLVLPSSLEEAVDVLVRTIVTIVPSAAPRRSERVPTDKIAVIGDLPPAADVVMLDLRAGGRRGLWTLAVAAIALVSVTAGILVRAGREETSTVAVREPEAPAASTPIAPPPSAPAPVAVVAAPHAPVVPAPKPHITHTPAPAAKHVAAPAPIETPAELQLAPDDDDTCSQDSCARHNNVRECCTPFRDQHVAKLDRTAIARATSSIKAKVHECRDPDVSDGIVRISVEVAPDGSVDQTLVLESPGSGVGRCVADVLHGLTFAATDAGGSFVYRTDLGAD